MANDCIHCVCFFAVALASSSELCILLAVPPIITADAYVEKLTPLSSGSTDCSKVCTLSLLKLVPPYAGADVKKSSELSLRDVKPFAVKEFRLSYHNGYI